MQINLKQAEIEIAVRQYISNMGISAPISDVAFTATRGSDGIIAEVEIGNATAVAVLETPVNKVDGGTVALAPAKAKKAAAPKGDTQAVATPETDDEVKTEVKVETTGEEVPKGEKKSLFGGG